LIQEAIGVRLASRALRLRIIALLEQFPEIRRVFVEVNQGGDLWKEALHDLTVPVISHSASESKEVRFARALNYWQRGRVVHGRRLHVLERQAVTFPDGAHDDVLDGACSGVLHFLHAPPKPRAGIRSDRYI
jgi:phage terminase large subunit-like protein